MFPNPAHLKTPAQWKTAYFLLDEGQVALQKHGTDQNGSLGMAKIAERAGTDTPRTASDLEQTGPDRTGPVNSCAWHGMAWPGLAGPAWQGLA